MRRQLRPTVQSAAACWTNNGAPVAGVVTNLSGTQQLKTITNAKGEYYFDNIEMSGFYVVTPARANYSGDPQEAHDGRAAGDL
jgi:hypothetical protein